MDSAEPFGILAGNNMYPVYMIRGIRKYLPGVKIYAVAFKGETDPEIESLVDEVYWARVGQISKPLKFLKQKNVKRLTMVGQLAPKNLFSLRPDLKALMMLAKLPKRNAETLFGAIADLAESEGIHVLPANSYMEDFMAKKGHIAGPEPTERQMQDAVYGMEIAKEVSRLDIGQTVLVRHGTVLAVEGFEGTNECIKRGGLLGRRKHVTLAKVSKPNHDMRFDIPVIGVLTLEVCRDAGVNQIVLEAGKTVVLQPEELGKICNKHKITLHAL